MTDVHRKLGESAARLASSTHTGNHETFLDSTGQYSQSKNSNGFTGEDFHRVVQLVEQVARKMDTPQTPRAPNELLGRQGPPSVGPNPQNQPNQPQGSGSPNPRFPIANNGPVDGPPRFVQPGGPSPSRPLNPGQGQFAPPRPSYGPPQRAPPPRNVFFGRPSQPGSPSGGPPVRFPPPGQFQPPLGLRPFPPGGFPNRAPFSPSTGNEAPRALRPPLQRNDSLGAPNLVRPNIPGDQQQVRPQLVDRRAQFRPQISIDRMADSEVNVQQRPPTSASLRSEDIPRPKSALNENGEANKLASEHRTPSTDNLDQQNVKHQKNVTIPQKEVPVVKDSEPASPFTESPVPNAVSPPPKTPGDNTSIKGFDDGQRRSLSSAKSSANQSPKSPALSPVPPAVTEKRTTFVIQDATRSENTNDKLDIKNKSEVKEKPDQTKAKPDVKLHLNPPSARTIRTDAENDSGVDETTQRREAPKANGVANSPTKKSRESDKRSSASSPVKSPSKSVKSLPRTPDAAPSTANQEKKKVPMNKIQVGAAPSPNLKSVRSKIGSLDNTTYKPGGGKIKIENRKLDFSKAQPKIAAKNDKYTPSGGDKKIQQVKLQWNAKPKIGSLDNATYKPGGGDKKIETVKLDFKDKAKPKVGSKDNAKHVPGGGTVKSAATPPKSPQDNANDIETQKIEIKAESKIGSLDNVKHKPGGGDKKIFDDKTYLRQTSSSNVGSVTGSGSQSPVPSGTGSVTDKNGLPISDENLNQEC